MVLSQSTVTASRARAVRLHCPYLSTSLATASAVAPLVDDHIIVSVSSLQGR